MIKIFLKHMFAEHAINTLFDKVGINFMSRSDKIRKVIIKRFQSTAHYERKEAFATIVYEIGKCNEYYFSNSDRGRGGFIIKKITIGPPVRLKAWPSISHACVSTYTDTNCRIDCQLEIFETLIVEYY